MNEIELNKCNCYFCIYHKYKNDYGNECYCKIKEGNKYHKVNCYSNNYINKDLIKQCPHKECIK